MLSDDISSGGSWIVDRTRRFLQGGVRGALLFGAVALAGATLLIGGQAIVGAALAGTLFSSGIMTGLAASLVVLAKVAVSSALPWAAFGAAGGAAIMSVANVLPSAREAFSTKPDPSLSPSMDASGIGQSQALSQNPNREQLYGNFENPYAQPDLGAKLAARGTQAAPALDASHTRV